jgi:hypothetical protein
MRHSSNAIPITGFVLLTGMVMVLLLTATSEAWTVHPAAGTLASIVTIGTIIALFFEIKDLLTQKIKAVKTATKVFEFLAVLIGGLTTFYLSIEIGLGAVVAASLIGILADMVAPKYGVPAYCGAFVGMSSNALFFNHAEVALASAIAGIVYVITRDVFGGFGGKLGTIAFIGASIAGFSLGREFLITPIADWTTNFWVLVVALVAAPLTFYLNCPRNNGPVLASSVVGLFAGLTLPALFPQLGSHLAVVAICASFTGMSNTKRCPQFWNMLVAGLFTGVLFVFATPLLGGAGGKLGTIAFASIIATDGFIELYRVSRGEEPIYRTD